MKKLYSTFTKITFSENSVPWILLLACVLSFGLLIPQLGYFQDDWSVVFNHYLYGNKGIIDLMSYDGRPFSPWLYLIGFDILGYKPTAWHIAALVMRWLAVVAMWSVFKVLWPKSGWQNLTAALIFALYPFFTLQPLAATFILHWTSYLLYGISIYLMLLSSKERFWLYTILALLAEGMHLFTLEFYSGIELLRPVFLWLALASMNFPRQDRLKKVLKQWAPYLIVFVIFFVWRGLVYQAPEAGRNAPVGLTGLVHDPITTLVSTALTAIPDLVLIQISAWYKLIEPAAFDFQSSINRYVLLLEIVSFLVLLYYFSRTRLSQEAGDSHTGEMFGVGVLALLLGLVPVYVAGYEIHTKLAPWNSRFSLGSLFGAALIVTAAIDYAVKIPKTKWVIVSVLFGLLVGWHVRYTNDFRWAWEKQTNFYRQLYLRAPELVPGTALLSEEEFIAFMGNYSTSYGINLIYDKENGSDDSSSREANYWLFTFADFSTDLDAHLQGEPFSIGTQDTVARAGIKFQGAPQGSVVMTFVPEDGQCLWIIRPEYAVSKALSDTTRNLAPLSNVDRIQPGPPNKDSFLFKYLYTNQKQDWCFYYEKADLAYQYGEWDQVIRLWETAGEDSQQPGNGFEYLPFIEAYAHTGDWGTAKKLTRTSQKTMQGIEPLLCNLWSGLENDTPASSEKEASVSSIRADLRCDQQ